MSEKMTCPACEAHTSGVRWNYQHEEPCPHCGLPPAVADEVFVMSAMKDADDLRRRWLRAEIKAAKAEADLVELRSTVISAWTMLEDAVKG